MAKRSEDAVPQEVRNLARYLGVPDADRYVGTAESGLGVRVHDALREHADADAVQPRRRRRWLWRR